MTDQLRDPKSLLSELQIERTLQLQIGIGAEAMCAAAKLADVLEVDEDGWRQIVTQTGAVMDANKIPFSVREEIREKYFELARLLGREAVGDMRPSANEHGLFISQDEATEEPPTAVVRLLDEARDDGQNHEDTDKTINLDSNSQSEVKPFTKVQEKWLRGLFNEKQMTSILEMSPVQVDAFIDRLCDLYDSLDFKKKPNETKLEDIVVIGQFLRGATYSEIAEKLGKSYNTVYVKVNNIASSYLRLATDNQLAETIKLSEDSAETTLGDNWLDEVAGEGASDFFNQLTPDQKITL